MAIVQRISYAGDNRVIADESSYRSRCLPPRCRLITSSWCTRWEGFDCSSIKVVRELGSIRRIMQQLFDLRRQTILYAKTLHSYISLNIVTAYVYESFAALMLRDYTNQSINRQDIVLIGSS